MIGKNIFTVFALLAILIFSPVSAFAVNPTQITESSITWNVTGVEMGTTVSYVSFDGINISGVDPDARIFIQSGLGPGEWHSIRVETSDTLSQFATAKTNESAVASSTVTLNNQGSALAEFFNTWIYLILIVIFIAAGLIRRLGFLEVIASLISLYALVKYISENDLSVTDIWHINFLLYIFLFIFPYIIVYFKGGFTK